MYRPCLSYSDAQRQEQFKRQMPVGVRLRVYFAAVGAVRFSRVRLLSGPRPAELSASLWRLTRAGYASLVPHKLLRVC